jgi:CRP-like cAMP-binding protein
VFFAIGGIFLVATFVVRTIVPMRLLTVVSIVFFVLAAALSGSVPMFLLYLLALPINVVRLVQIRNLVKKARSSAQGTMSLDWLRPYMTPRGYQKGEVLFRKGDAATEMFVTVSGRFLVTEIGIEIPPDRILGELGFLSPNNNRTQSVECVESGDVLTISYEKLLEVYFQNPEFGYFFLRLTSDRLMQNSARLTSLIEQNQAALQATTAPKEAAGARERTPLRAMLAALRSLRQKAPRGPTPEEIAASARQRVHPRAAGQRGGDHRRAGAHGATAVPALRRAVPEQSRLRLGARIDGWRHADRTRHVRHLDNLFRSGPKLHRARGLIGDRLSLCPRYRPRADRPFRSRRDARARSPSGPAPLAVARALGPSHRAP